MLGSPSVLPWQIRFDKELERIELEVLTDDLTAATLGCISDRRSRRTASRAAPSPRPESLRAAPDGPGRIVDLAP